MVDSAPGSSSTVETTIEVIEKQREFDTDLRVHINSNADGQPQVHTVLEDGTFVAAAESAFDRTSAAAANFVARTVAARHGTPLVDTHMAALDPTNKDTADFEHSYQYGEAALYEVGKCVAVLEGLRVGQESNENPALVFRRVVKPIQKRDGIEATFPASTLRDAPAILMAKRRSLAKSASILSDCASNMRKWVKDDNEFSDAFHFLRTKACGVRRSSGTGAPLIDVGDGHFAEVKRLSASERDELTDPDAMVDNDASGDVPLAKRCLVRVTTPPNTYLCIGLERLELDCVPVAAPVINCDGLGDVRDDISLEGVLRRIRLARVSAFRKMTFERMIQEASEMSDATDYVTNSITVESGPYDMLRIDCTMRQVAPSLEIGGDGLDSDVTNFRKMQDASLLQMVILHQSISTRVRPKEHVKQGKGVFDRALVTTCALSVVRGLEKVHDDIEALLGVRVRWARGGTRAEEVRVCVSSDEADGDGPSRVLLAIEPISTKNNSGRACCSGHVKLTPAFGVIIPAPEDPNARGRAGVLLAQSSASSGSTPSILFDDVPRSYVCPVYSGGEIVAAVTLVLCIRLLDALEIAARSSEAEVLDVDRQCFTVVVSSPQSGGTLRAKVWPKEDTSSHEVPATTAWLNGKIVDDFPVTSPGRLVAWKKLLGRLVNDKVGTSAYGSEPGQSSSGLLNGFAEQ